MNHPRPTPTPTPIPTLGADPSRLTVPGGLRPLRWLVSIPIVGLVIGVGTGCGAGDPPARPAYTSIVHSRAHAVAPLLTIRPADLPEFKVTAHPAAAQEGPEDAHEARCLRRAAPQVPPSARSTGAAKHARQPRHRSSPSLPAHRSSQSQRRWAFAKSQQLSAGSGYHTLGASSSVSIMPTSAAASLQVAEEERLDRTCLEHALRGRFARKHLRLPVSGVVVEPLSVSVKGADASIAYQIIVGYRGAPLVLYMDAIELAYGQDLIELFTYHSSKPVPPAMDERLLGLLVARARSHSR
jgi:hypothetical protein